MTSQPGTGSVHKQQTIIQIFKYVIPVQILIAGFFFTIVSTESFISIMLGWTQQVPHLLNYVPNTVLRCQWSLLTCFFVLAWFTYKNFMSKDGESRAEYIFQICVFSFFAYYLVCTRTLQFPVSGDDAYIDYRYVKNIINGLGPVYNPGEYVLGFTSYLHIGFLYIFTLIAGIENIPVVSQLLNAGLQLIAYLTLFILVQDIYRNRNIGIFAAAIFSMMFFNIQQSMFGKETALVTCLAVLSLWANHNSRTRIFAWTACLLFLTRPEGVFWMGICLVRDFYKKQKSEVLRAWVPPLVLTGLIYTLIIIQFGTVMPHGGIAKKVIYTPTPATHYLSFLSQLMSTWFTGDFGYTFFYKTCRYLAIPLLCVWTLWRTKSLRIYGCILLAIGTLYLIRNNRLFLWYFAWYTLLPPLVMSNVVYSLLKLNTKKTSNILGIIATGIVVLTLMIHAGAYPTKDTGRIQVNMPVFHWAGRFTRLLQYRNFAEHLNSLNEKAVAATAEPGIFGFYYNGYVLDMGGLVSPGVTKYYPLPIEQHFKEYAISANLVKDRKPTYIVFYDSFAKYSLLADEDFKANYKAILFSPFEIWDSRGLWLYKRIADGSS